MKKWQFWLGFGVSAVFLWMALRGLDLSAVFVYIREGNYLWLIPSVTVYFIAVWVRTWRWDYMLRPLKKIPVRRLFPVVVIGYMGNNVYPFRIGELLRSYVLYRREDIAISASLATVVVERVFDGLVMLVFVFVALPLVPLPENAAWISNIVVWASAAFFVALILFFIMAARPQFAYQFAERMFNLFLPQRWREPLLGVTARFLTGLGALNNLRDVLMIFFTSVLIWLLETVKYWFVMQAFNMELSFFALMLMNGIVNLATTLPSAPGYVGTFDEPGIRVLTLYGVKANLAAAYTLVLHAALWLPITLLGFYYMIREGLSWSDFGKAVEVAQAENQPQVNADGQ
ncbi:MAG: flippase-like domain-containing protein [Anaerolineae bacterium]|nr:flippase-like domain-containing protein [Anaerolineae bacterium]MCO5197344.1 flippase-like domain-containing protein [Anaerolineae bacterium]